MIHNLRSRALAVLLLLALCLGLLPVTALAAGDDVPATLYVGETQITASGYWTTDTNGKLSAGDASNYNVYYDGSGTLTLNNATIQGGRQCKPAGPSRLRNLCFVYNQSIGFSHDQFDWHQYSQRGRRNLYSIWRELISGHSIRQ